jgi:NAD(P)-dependent dehydrogenase (short-subunit alcohol dehydrogenase family)
MAKSVWITGCTRGLGRALVEGFVADGWTVVGCGRSEGSVTALGEEFEGENLFRAVDVTDDAAVADFCREALKATGAPDLLVNNAGMINQPAPLWEVGAEEFGAVIDVNLKGVANMIRHAVPAMIERGSGVIVNLSSGWGRSTSPEVAPYCATKWGVEGLTEALSQELPSGLAAVALNPGVIDTDMLRQAWGDGAGAYGTAAEWGKIAVPFLQGLGVGDNGGALTVG